MHEFLSPEEVLRLENFQSGKFEASAWDLGVIFSISNLEAEIFEFFYHFSVTPKINAKNWHAGWSNG
jgi:hypothetical protein